MTRTLRVLFATSCLFAGLVLHGQDGALDPTFNPGDVGFGFGDGAGGRVGACVKQADGKIIIGGGFYYYNMTSAFRIKRLNADGSPDAGFGAGVADTVFALALASDGKVLVGGRFNAGQGPVSGITRLNIDGSTDVSFGGTGANAAVRAIAVQPDGKILIGGEFTAYSGSAAFRIARINVNGSLDLTFNAGTGPNGRVSCIEVQADGKVLIAGEFTAVNGTTRGRVARLNSNGALDATFGSGAGSDAAVRAMELLPDGRVLIGGDLLSYSGVARSRLAMLTSSGALDAMFDAGGGANGNVHALQRRANGQLAIGGAFTAINGQTRNRIALLESTGMLVETFDPLAGANATVQCMLEVNAGHLLIGGDHSAYRDDYCGHLTWLDVTGAMDLAFNHSTVGVDSPTPAYIYALAEQPDHKILLGGILSGYGGKARHCIARCHPDGALDETFDPGTPMPMSGAHDIALQPDGKILIGGWFTSYHGVARNRIARLNADGSLDISFDPGSGAAGGDVHDIALLPDGRILIAGSFTSYNGSNSPGIARLNANGSFDSGFIVGTGANSTVKTMFVQPDGRILIGGYFTTFNGVARGGIARLLSGGGLDATFDPGTGADNFVNRILLEPDGRILLGGFFLSINGASKPRIARLLANGSVDNTYQIGAGFNNEVTDIHRDPDGKIIAVGSFSQFNGINRRAIVRLNQDGTLDPSLLSSNGAAGIETTITLGTGKLLIGGWFTSYGSTNENPIGRNRLARLKGTTRAGIRLALEGPYNGSTMSDALRTLPSFPLTEPFTALGYSETGYTPGATIASSVLSTSGSNAIVDWVIVEMRPAATPTVVAASRAVLLQRDGDVVDLDGASTVGFGGLAHGNYCVVVKPRNHLPVMLTPSAPFAYGTSTETVDFTVPSTQVYDNDARKNVGGVMLLQAGDATFNEELMYVGLGNDRDPILARIGGSTPTATVSGYWPEDVNMDGVVKYVGANNDRDLILLNVGGSTPTAVRNAALP